MSLSIRLKEDEYYKLTYELTINFAEEFKKKSGQRAGFLLCSGCGI
jgi:hypothetical protein